MRRQCSSPPPNAPPRTQKRANPGQEIPRAMCWSRLHETTTEGAAMQGRRMGSMIRLTSIGDVIKAASVNGFCPTEEHGVNSLLIDCPGCGGAQSARLQPTPEAADVASIWCSTCRWVPLVQLLTPCIAAGRKALAEHQNEARRSYLLIDLLADARLMAPPPMLIAGLLRILGITLLHGREKLGKSTLSAQIAAALTRGGEFLGRPVRRTFVVWIAADEPMQDAAKRLREFGADERSVLIVDGRRGPQELRAELKKAAGYADGLDLVVVIDTLAELVSPMITSENDSAPMIKALRQYVEVIRAASAACILVHHSNKSGSDYRGSQAIGGIVDAVAQFRERYAAKADPTAPPQEAEGEFDTRRVLEVRSRWAAQQKWHLTFIGSRYELGDLPVPIEERIRMQLRGEPGISGSQLATRIGAKKQAVLDALNKLVAAKLVERFGTDKRPLHRLPRTESEPPSAEGRQEAGTDAEPIAGSRGAPSVPELPSVPQTPEPIGFQGEEDTYWELLLADESTLEPVEDAA
jgi:hypothetical protein